MSVISYTGWSLRIIQSKQIPVKNLFFKCQNLCGALAYLSRPEQGVDIFTGNNCLFLSPKIPCLDILISCRVGLALHLSLSCKGKAHFNGDVKSKYYAI